MGVNFRDFGSRNIANFYSNEFFCLVRYVSNTNIFFETKLQCKVIHYSDLRYYYKAL